LKFNEICFIMTKKKQSDGIEISFETLRRINWLDEIQKLPHDVDKSLSEFFEILKSKLFN